MNLEKIQTDRTGGGPETEVVSEQNFKLTVGDKVLQEFIKAMAEYEKHRKGKIVYVVKRKAPLENDVTVRFTGTDQECKDFLNYLKKLDKYSKQRTEVMFGSLFGKSRK